MSKNGIAPHIDDGEYMKTSTQRTTTARKVTSTAMRLILPKPELAQLDAEVARRKSAAPSARTTRTGVLLSLVRGLPPVQKQAQRRPLREGKDKIGRYIDVTVGAASMRFRWMEPGTFTMGSPDSELGRWSDEGPQHKVRLTKGYWLADSPTTQAFYEAVMGSNPSRYRGAANPVEMVSWDDAVAFIGKLNGLVPGLDARLPTEAEWEKACRGGTKGATYKGELEDTWKAPVLDAIAWYYGNADGKTHPVKTKAPNAFGLYDMLGNVWEWCADWHGEYEAKKATDPRGPSSGTCRVLRGGSWGSGAGVVRAASRGAYGPCDRGGGVGFRLARGQ